MVWSRTNIDLTIIDLTKKGVTAHRGGSEIFPENTLAAFRSAIELGVDWIETDVRLTRDGELVIMHDSHLGRVTGVDAKVREVSLAEILELKLGEGPQYHQIPTLRQVCELVKDTPTRLSLQPKSDCVEQIVKLVTSLKLTQQIGFNDRDLTKMSRAKELLDVPVFWDRLETQDLDAELKLAVELGFHAMVIFDQHLTRDIAVKIQNAGLAAGAWTVNEGDRLRELITWGVDIIYTDTPSELIRIKEEHKATT